jgi:hypothetical protein
VTTGSRKRAVPSGERRKTSPTPRRRRVQMRVAPSVRRAASVGSTSSTVIALPIGAAATEAAAAAAASALVKIEVPPIASARGDSMSEITLASLPGEWYDYRRRVSTVFVCAIVGTHMRALWQGADSTGVARGASTASNASVNAIPLLCECA